MYFKNMVNILLAVFFVLFYTKTVVNSREIVFDGIPNDDSLEIQIINGKSLNSSLNALLPGDIFIIKNHHSNTFSIREIYCHVYDAFNKLIA